MEIRDKIELKEKGGEANLTSVNRVHAQLRWKKAVDLDLYALFEMKNGRKGKIYYSQRSISGIPIRLDQDAGVGDTGGDNEENMYFEQVHTIKHVLIVANIYAKAGASFASYDGGVIVEADTQQVSVPLSSTLSGNWCIVAHFDNSSPIGAKLTNINKVYNIEPTLEGFLGNRLTESTTQGSGRRGGGILGRLFS